MRSDYWHGKRVLVTGAGGFIGGHLTERLFCEGAKVIAFVHRPLERTKHLKGNLEDVVIMDLTSEHVTAEVIAREPTVIYHLAANPDIRASLENPLDSHRVNMRATLRLLEIVRTSRFVERFVFSSSSAVYGGSEHPLSESALVSPKTPYAASKASADIYCQAYAKSFHLPITIVRPFNVYGPRQALQAPIPSFIRAALRGGPIQLDGDGRQTRDFMYVDDIVEGLLHLGECSPVMPGDIVNLGSGVDTSIREVVDKIISLCNSSSPIVFGPQRPGQEMRVCCNNAKAKDYGWQPKVSFEDGLRRTIEFYKR